MLILAILIILIVAAFIVTQRQQRGGTDGSPIVGGAPLAPRSYALPPAAVGGNGAERVSIFSAAYYEANWKTLLQRFAILLVYAAMLFVFWLLIDVPRDGGNIYLTWSNHNTVWFSAAAVVVLALGLILPLTAGDFDLSVASVMVLSAMLVGALSAGGNWGTWPVGLAILAALAAGALVGCVNAFFIIYFRIHSLIVTLGVGTIVNGVVLWFSKSATISNISLALVDAMIERAIFNVPLNVFYTILIAVLMWYFLEYTAPGRRLLFVGRGREVARLAGIRVDRVRAGSLIACSTIAALAGVMLVGMTGSAEPITGRFNVLPAFAGAFLGATCIYPGRFNPLGTLIGLYFLATGVNGLSILGLPSFIQDLFYGGGLVIAVTLSQLVLRRQQQNF
jgi:ribose transport system permease protein